MQQISFLLLVLWRNCLRRVLQCLQKGKGRCSCVILIHSPKNLSLYGTNKLGKDFPLNSNSGLLRCAVCQAEQSLSDGLFVNSGTFFSPVSKPWEAPFLCANCRTKKDAMEGKRPSRPTLTA